MPTLEFLRNEIENRRRQLSRQRKEIQSLRRAGLNTTPAEELFSRMVAKVIELCAERDRQVEEQRIEYRKRNADGFSEN
jgi:hypothetical protein